MAKKLTDNFILKSIKVEDLKEWELNPRIHSDKGLRDLKESITQFGVIVFLFCDSDLTIVGGHARKKALMELGIEEVKCFVAKKKLTERDFKVCSLLSNSIYSEFNIDKLNENLEPKKLMSLGFGLDKIYFESDKVELDDEEKYIERERKHKINFKFGSESEFDVMEELMSKLNLDLPELESDGERLIQFLVSVL